MSSIILHIWGPFAIHAYGFFIALGAILFLSFMQRDDRFQLLKLENTFNTIFMCGVLAILIGGRGLHVWREYAMYDSWIEWFYLWEPGYAVLGSTLAVITMVPLCLYYYKIPNFPFFDLVATYIPLLEGVGRIGCFFAGCCFGCATTVPWAISYTDPFSLAPLSVSMHPTQLYSAAALLLIFLWMYFYVRHRFLIPGQQTMIFLMLAASERFLVDFWRGDREIIFHVRAVDISFHQIIALGIILTAITTYCWLTVHRKYQAQ